ncbi:MAG TPA: choice-of-anchor tandem repeat GloVer-containing protein [Candidatus Binatus sp.]|nr:choice-of-anchor tandem repeat GloVer-containing protein [Candidatus Binatus sp.]
MQLKSLLRTAATLAVFSVPLLPSVQTAQAQTETVLYSFCSVGFCYDGAAPGGSLTPDRYGNFYGTLASGGTAACAYYACVGGAIFQLSPEPAAGCPSGFNQGSGWCETVLYSFCSPYAYYYQDCPDGASPISNLTLAPPLGHFSTAVGTFYGTTSNGGTGCSSDPNGCGIAFELSPEPLPIGFGCPSGTNLGNGWCETVLYNFDTYPSGGLVRDSSRNLYGITQNGVFELSPNGSSWTEAMIYPVPTNGGGLAIDASGNLYGEDNNQNVFKLSRNSSGVWVATNIHTFTGVPDGYNPTGAPAVDSLGNVYGTTANGGSGTLNCVYGCGTVWKLTPVKTGTLAGTYTKRILHSFTGEKTGYYPGSGVTLDSSGNIYGTTTTAGKYLTPCQNTNNVNIGCGTIFELAKSTTGYTFKLLWSFNNTDGGFPYDNPVLDSAGNLYGTAFQGGASYNGGVVFKLNPSGTATATTLISSLNPSTYGEEVTFTAVVTPAPLNGETITFERGTTALGTGVLSGGSASFKIATLPLGTSDVKAVYGGDGDYKASTSNTVPQVVKD